MHVHFHAAVVIRFRHLKYIWIFSKLIEIQWGQGLNKNVYRR